MSVSQTRRRGRLPAGGTAQEGRGLTGTVPPGPVGHRRGVKPSNNDHHQLPGSPPRSLAKRLVWTRMQVFTGKVSSMSESHKRNPETILVVDDDENVRTLVVAILERAHFTTISANSGPKTISLSERTEGRIDLRLTDWDMPERSGIALGQWLKVFRPDLHVMRMSGGAHDTLKVLNYGWAYLQKSFVGVKLVETVTAVLHSPEHGGESFDSRRDTDPNSPQAKDPDNHPADENEPKYRGK